MAVADINTDGSHWLVVVVAWTIIMISRQVEKVAAADVNTDGSHWLVV